MSREPHVKHKRCSREHCTWCDDREREKNWSWDEMYTAYAHACMDRDYYKSIVEGSWPDADEVIANCRDNKADTTIEG